MSRTLWFAIGVWLALSIACGLARAADPPPPPFCAPASANAIACVDSSTCPAPQVCTRDYNQQIKHAWPQGHCIDVAGTISATHAIQADLCSLPNPVNFSAGTKYNLPAQARLKITDPDGDGKGITIYRQTIFDGNGAALKVPNAAPGMTVFRVVVPINKVEFEYLDNGRHGSWSSVRDLSISPETTQPMVNFHTGIQLSAAGTRTDNLQIHRMGRCFDVNGTISEGYNANNVSLTNPLAYGCTGFGIITRGGDGNGGYVLGAQVNGGTGVMDRSFLGVLWAGLQIEGNDKISNDPVYGGQLIGVNVEGNYSTYLHTYVELSDRDPQTVSSTTSFMGGNANYRLKGPASRYGGGYDYFFARPNKYDAPSGSTPKYTLRVGGRDPLTWQSQGEYYANKLRIRPVGAVTNGTPADGVWEFSNEGDVYGDKSVFNWKLNFANRIGYYSAGRRLVPFPESGVEMCTDGYDNDGDGKIDALDTGCSP